MPEYPYIKGLSVYINTNVNNGLHLVEVYGDILLNKCFFFVFRMKQLPL